MLTFNNLGNLGRLANQMFQYASLKGIARKCGYEYCIPPLEVFGQNDPLVRASELNIYNVFDIGKNNTINILRNPMLQESCLLYTSPSPRDKRQSRMPSSA